MVTVKFDLSDEEYTEFVSKIRGKTTRAAILDAMGVSYAERRMGRPTDAEVDQRIEDYYAKCRQNQTDIYFKQLHDKLVADAAKTAESKKLLGIDSEEKTVPAWGTTKESEE